MDWRFYLAHPGEILGTLRSGGVLLGGVVAGALTFAFYASRHELPKWRLGDAAMAPVALAQAIGRLGCFSAGCCWGEPCEAAHPLAVVFTNPDAWRQTGVPLGQPLVAVQLVQAAHDLLLAGLLTWLWRRRPEPPGTIVWTYVLLYSLGRGLIEFWRGDDAQRGVWFGGEISTSQIFALCGAAIALAMLVRARLGRQQEA
jgi:phosphatidylglycerol:prolipoprotein diacylglycerol transferase